MLGTLVLLVCGPRAVAPLCSRRTCLSLDLQANRYVECSCSRLGLATSAAAFVARGLAALRSSRYCWWRAWLVCAAAAVGRRRRPGIAEQAKSAVAASARVLGPDRGADPAAGPVTAQQGAVRCALSLSPPLRWRVCVCGCNVSGHASLLVVVLLSPTSCGCAVWLACSPPDPVEWLAHYLLKHNPQKPTSSE